MDFAFWQVRINFAIRAHTKFHLCMCVGSGAALMSGGGQPYHHVPSAADINVCALSECAVVLLSTFFYDCKSKDRRLY